MSSLLDGDVVLSSGSGSVIVEQNGMRIDVLNQLQLIGQLAAQLCFSAPNSPLPLWNLPNNLPTSSWGVATVSINRQIYIMGGTDGTKALNTMCIYDIDSNSWDCSLTLPFPIAFAFAAASPDGLSIYLFGGFSILNNGSDGADNYTVQQYNIQNGTWGAKSSMVFSHHRGSSAVIDDEVFFFGGTLPLSANVSSYTMSSDSWKIFNQTLPVGRWNTAAVAVDNFIYVMGGRIDSATLTQRVDKFDISASQQSWSQASDIVFPVEGLCVTNVNGLVVQAGGFNPAGLSSHNLVSTFNPRLNLWKVGVLSSLNYARDGCSLNFVDGTIYAIGGRFFNVTTQIVTAVGSIETAVPCF